MNTRWSEGNFGECQQLNKFLQDMKFAIWKLLLGRELGRDFNMSVLYVIIT